MPEDVFTEREAFADICRWSEDRPAWQRDALRRLIVNGRLDENDIKDLTQICEDEKASFIPLNVTHLRADGSTGQAISITQINNPTGINALAPDQALSFAKTGLTIVYGDNGSGKSGYVRILKHACRTRDGKLSILRDVEDMEATPQTADISFSREDETAILHWTPEGEGDPDLASVNIFDSKSANIHVEKTNEVAYTPAPMQVLEALANACDEKRKICRGYCRARGADSPCIKTFFP
jgi:hypothetical protein